MALIGLYSPVPQSGKSTFARVLNYEYDYRVVKFADPIKDMLRGLLKSMGFRSMEIERMVEGHLKEQVIPGFTTVTPRHLMQSLGTAWGREAVDNDIWVKVARRKIEVLQATANVVVDDVRFYNEYQLIKEMGGTLVRIDRTNAPNPGENRCEALLNNELFDHYVANDGDIEELWFKARMIAQELQSD